MSNSCRGGSLTLLPGKQKHTAALNSNKKLLQQASRQAGRQTHSTLVDFVGLALVGKKDIVF